MINDIEVRDTLRARMLTASGLPTSRSLEGEDFNPPAATTPYIEEEYVPGPRVMASMTKSNGLLVGSGLYRVRVYGRSGSGTNAIRAICTAILAVLTPGYSTTLTNTDALHVDHNPAPEAGQIIPLTNGRAFGVVVVPWYVFSQNAA